MKKSVLTTLVVLCITFIAMSQEPKAAFTPNGKPFVKVFSNFHSKFSDGKSASAFELTRAYLGYEYFFSEKFSGKLNFDIGNPGVGGLQMTAYIKNAYLQYQEKNLTVNFGMISTTEFKIQEDLWANRYVEKVFQDLYGMAPSADLGVSVSYKFNDILSADVALTNGEGYKKLQADSVFKSTLGLTINPVKQLTIRGMVDFMGSKNTQSTLAGFVSYSGEKFMLAAEYNYQKNVGMSDGRDLFGPSVYANVNASKKIKIFGRFDDLSSNTLSGQTQNWNASKDGQLFMAGLEYAPVKGIKIAPNYQGWNPAQSSKPYLSTLMVNVEMKF